MMTATAFSDFLVPAINIDRKGGRFKSGNFCFRLAMHCVEWDRGLSKYNPSL